MRAPASGTMPKITVVLVSKAAADLARTRVRSSLSQTDIVNRAISFYDFVDEELAHGAELLLRRLDGATYLVDLH